MSLIDKKKILSGRNIWSDLFWIGLSISIVSTIGRWISNYLSSDKQSSNSPLKKNNNDNEGIVDYQKKENSCEDKQEEGLTEAEVQWKSKCTNESTEEKYPSLECKITKLKA